jgi:5'-nucleotidase
LHWDGKPMLLNGTVLRDADVLALLEKYRPGIAALQTEIVGRSKVLLDNTNCRFKECNLGNLIADSMAYAYASRYSSPDNYWTDAPVALIQGGGLRASFVVRGTNGDMSKAALSSILPFGNPLWVVQVTGKELREVFEHSVSR